MTEYDLVATSIRKKFIAEVNAKLAEGWQLYGSPIVLIAKPLSSDPMPVYTPPQLVYLQPMTRENKVEFQAASQTTVTYPPTP